MMIDFFVILMILYSFFDVTYRWIGENWSMEMVIKW